MKSANISDMIKGWFIGDFSPSILKSADCEVAVKYYSAGDVEAAHHHKVAVEVTVIVSGIVRMAGREWGSGDIIRLEPGEVTDFEAITDAINVVVKLPSVINDKFIDQPLA